MGWGGESEVLAGGFREEGEKARGGAGESGAAMMQYTWGPVRRRGRGPPLLNTGGRRDVGWSTTGQTWLLHAHRPCSRAAGGRRPGCRRRRPSCRQPARCGSRARVICLCRVFVWWQEPAGRHASRPLKQSTQGESACTACQILYCSHLQLDVDLVGLAGSAAGVRSD